MRAMRVAGGDLGGGGEHVAGVAEVVEVEALVAETLGTLPTSRAC